MSTHTIQVVQIESVTKHPNADRLDVALVDGLNCIVTRDQYKAGDLCIFVPPDYEVPLDREEFAILRDKNKGKTRARIRAMNLRGVRSFGFVLPAPDGAKLGDEMMEVLGITRWESPFERGETGPNGSSLQNGENEKAPNVNAVVYDVENAYKHRKVLEGKTIIATEKIHGANWRAVCVDGKIFVGSRRLWKRKPGPHTRIEKTTKTVPLSWWKILITVVSLGFIKFTPDIQIVETEVEYEVKTNSWWQGLTPQIEAWLLANPNHILYGEVYGTSVQGTKFGYDAPAGGVKVRIFDVQNPNNTWVGADALYNKIEYRILPKPPIVFSGEYNQEALAELIEGDSPLGGKDHVMEGVVIKEYTSDNLPMSEQRLCLKMVSARYLQKS